jgi:nucleotide-binding universal stress UspA family protein
MAEPLRQLPPPEERGKAPRKVAIALDSAADTARAQVRWAIKYALHSNDEVSVLHGPTQSGEMKLKHDSHAYTAAAVVMRGAVDSLVPFVDPKHRPTAVVFSATEGDDVRDLIVEYVNSNAIDLLIIGRRSIESPYLHGCCMRKAGSDARACAAKVRKPSTGSVSSYCLHHCNSAVLVVNETTLHADVA